MALAAMVMTGQLPGGRMRGDVSLHVSSAWGDGEPPSRAHKCSPLSKMFPVVEKKTLIKLHHLVCKLGYLLFVPKKKKPENQLTEGPMLRIALVTVQYNKKSKCQKQQTWQKLSKQHGPSSRVDPHGYQNDLKNPQMGLQF